MKNATTWLDKFILLVLINIKDLLIDHSVLNLKGVFLFI